VTSSAPGTSQRVTCSHARASPYMTTVPDTTGGSASGTAGRGLSGTDQLTLTAAQAAFTALYWVLPTPEMSLAAFSDAVRAPW
jgi:hypothetical protein